MSWMDIHQVQQKCNGKTMTWYYRIVFKLQSHNYSMQTSVHPAKTRFQSCSSDSSCDVRRDKNTSEFSECVCPCLPLAVSQSLEIPPNKQKYRSLHNLTRCKNSQPWLLLNHRRVVFARNSRQASSRNRINSWSSALVLCRHVSVNVAIRFREQLRRCWSVFEGNNISLGDKCKPGVNYCVVSFSWEIMRSALITYAVGHSGMHKFSLVFVSNVLRPVNFTELIW